MAITKTFECENCDTKGKIVIKSEDITVTDVVYCPVCGADIFEDDTDED